ncbi:HAMP domain-containing sensor histidine kinase [Fusobacterium sp.]|uniref:sensor histidine kinase n=1 Tax=Fusobacterium sp. TaxID=68766 RepID=UPI0025C18F3C|nr:HAMP domain-containing sensor histidine kinase [Fusobacterium sp.]MCI7224282.1 HAMP domain-containing histidine kinase [Fusobacterium sp.]
MILKKDSLLLRIITYNGIAMIFVSAVMAVLFGVITINEINTRLLDKSREKVIILNKAYVSLIEKTERDLFDALINSLNFGNIGDENELQDKLALIVKNQLNLESYSKYNKSYVQVVSEKRKVLSENGSREVKYDIIGNAELVPSLKTLKDKIFYFVGTNGNLYVRIIQKFRFNKANENSFVILSLPLSNYSLQKVREFIDLKIEDKLFILSKNDYIFGELGTARIDNFLKMNKKTKLGEKFKEFGFYFSELDIKDEPYYLALSALNDDSDQMVGSIGIAISKKSFLAIKYMLATMILAISLLSVIVSTTLCARIFTKLLSPLSILAAKTKGIGKEKIDVDFEEESVYEIRTIANSIKSMTDRIKKNENLLLNRNEKLNDNLNRIIAVEKILMGVDIDKNFSQSITEILRALTSEIGMGYSRAIYLEYNEEKNQLEGKEVSINHYVSANIDKITQGISGFSFQINDLKKLLPLLKVKYEPGNLFWNSMETGKIGFFNDKGYKYNFGNELFKSLGFSNFLIFPISDDEIKVGCILIDYFGKDKLISNEEVEVLTLLLMNLVIRVKNDIQEERKMTTERILTMSKISNKFLDSNEKLLEKVESFIEKVINREYNSKDIVKINKYIEERKRQNGIMKDVLDNSERNFKAVNLEKLLSRIVKDHEVIMKKNAINLSLFTNFNGNIYADKKKIYQMFVEIIKNSMEAILIRNKLDKKINIVLTTAENNRVVIEVTDNGIGMEQMELNQLRKPYTSNKKNILGLGLTTIYSVVREHKGIITIASEQDEGTKIRIIFNEYREEKSL